MRVPLLAALVVMGGLSVMGGSLSTVGTARAQDEEDSSPEPPMRDFVPGPDTLDDTIHVTVRGHAEAIASSVVLEYIVRGPAENGAEAEKNYTKKIKAAVKGMLSETDPVTSLVTVDVVGHRKVQAAGFTLKLEQTGRAPFKAEAGVTFACRLHVGIRDLGSVPPRVRTKRLAEILAKLAENELTGAEDDVDIMFAHMQVDRDAMRAAAYADAFRAARARAATIARAAHRKLGKVTVVRENGWTCNDDQVLYNSDYYDILYPGNLTGWRAHLRVEGTVELSIAFQLE